LRLTRPTWVATGATASHPWTDPGCRRRGETP